MNIRIATSLSLVLITAFAGNAAAATFLDVAVSHPHEQAIDYLWKEGIVSGYPDGSFQPDKTINRAEFVKIVVGGTFTSKAWETCDPRSIYTFSDASHSDWYAPFLCVAVQHKLVEGHPDGSVMPDASINFVEAAKILVAADRIDLGGNPRYDRSLPETTGDWFAPYVQYLSDRGVIPLDVSHLDQKITRGQMAEMIYRLRSTLTSLPSRTAAELIR